MDSSEGLQSASAPIWGRGPSNTDARLPSQMKRWKTVCTRRKAGKSPVRRRTCLDLLCSKLAFLLYDLPLSCLSSKLISRFHVDTMHSRYTSLLDTPVARYTALRQTPHHALPKTKPQAPDPRHLKTNPHPHKALLPPQPPHPASKPSSIFTRY